MTVASRPPGRRSKAQEPEYCSDDEDHGDHGHDHDDDLHHYPDNHDHDDNDHGNNGYISAVRIT